MTTPDSHPLPYRVALVGCPPQPDVEWNAQNVGRLKALGFNTLQLNIAWGYRPADEPLNLEDIVEIPAGRGAEFSNSVPLRCDPSPARFTERRAALRHRIEVCKSAGMRSIFHFGAPYNAHARFGDNPPNCPRDPKVQQRYVGLMRLFAAQFPGVDDIWLYTYDQDAWLCSEFGTCPRCAGVPLHRTVTEFVNLLAHEWNHLQPGGRTWWEPWELSAGQVFRSAELLDKNVCGLALHSNVAEVMATQPVDRWLDLSTRLARDLGLPVIVEHVFGSATEELGAYIHIPSPQVLLRALRTILRLPLTGIKEYYGLLPDRHDPTLELTGLVLNHPELSDAEILQRLAAPYGPVAGKIIEYWTETSAAIDFFPWSTSWFMREIDECDPSHGMGAAFIRGQQAHTPSWESTRRCIFMKTDDMQPDPWMLEDVQLQCEMSAEHATKALELGDKLAASIPENFRGSFVAGLSELTELRRRILSFAYHLRETNLAELMRGMRQRGVDVPPRIKEELLAVLKADQQNQAQAEPCGTAIALLEKDLGKFLGVYFRVPEDGYTLHPAAAPQPTGAGIEPFSYKGAFTATTR
jgi:hypothetical protein